MKEILTRVLREISRVLESFSPDNLEPIVEALGSRKRVFLYGEGRTGLVARLFGIRLLQMGKEVYFPHDPFTPAFRRNDLILVMSGGGKRESIRIVMERAKKLGGRVVLITGNPSSSLRNLAHHTLVIPDALKEYNKSVSFQPLNSLFEQSLFIFLEGLVLILKERLGIGEEEMAENHANI